MNSFSKSNMNDQALLVKKNFHEIILMIDEMEHTAMEEEGLQETFDIIKGGISGVMPAVESLENKVAQIKEEEG